MSTVTTALPSALRLGVSRGRLELKMFGRERQAMVATVGMPLIFLLIFGSIFRVKVGDTGVQFQQYFGAGIIASGIMTATLVNLGNGITGEREDGTLKRLYGTPMPKAAYLIGKIISSLVISLVESVVLLAVGVALFGVGLPSTPGRWLTLAWVFLLGVGTNSLLGVAISSVPRSTRSAAAIINIPFLVLQFVSGIFWVFDGLPEPVQRFGAIFPLKWMAQGFRSALLPDSLLAAEPAHTWEHGRTAMVLFAWLVVGLVLSVTTFRWKRRRDG